ncbi:MAG TPA: nitroreductase family deazaflavin-dependent oxidoreductase [Thermoleophilaceae bacterium]|jgi:deazaflavin-dependent oxidoreductase (nitroreductase family)
MSITEQVLRVHDAIYKRSGGRFGHRNLGVPCLLLHSIGRRSGQPRSNSLVYARDGNDYLVVASNGGADNHPAWLFNVRAQPDVEIQVGRERMQGRARILEPADPDYERLWKIVNDNNSNRYSGYQEKTTRQIPIVVVTPN